MALQVPTVTVDDLNAFHAKHFPHVPVPEQLLHGVVQDTPDYGEEDDGLGYYPDGTKRTLTDEQIAMFRHSEIQSIIRERRQRHERDESSEVSEDGEANSPAGESAIPVPANEPDSRTMQHKSGSVNIDIVHSGRVEKLKTQQWATSSPRTKARNKRNRDKYKAKKREERLTRERAQREGRSKHNEDADESDEWDPWHQATGPDAQQADLLELDY